MKKLLSGNEAFARGAWEAGAKVVTGYPGTPSTEVLENISKDFRDDVYCEWSPNEKVAFEVAAGSSLAGVRTMTTMKHVGLNVAADPLMTFAYVGAVGGFIALVADDPGMNSSQNEQDTRQFARFAKIPVFEPSDSEEARTFVKYAFEISEKFTTPVIMRSTTTVSHSRGVVNLGERKKSTETVRFEKDPPRFVPIPAWGRQMRLRLEERLESLREESSVSPLNRIEWKERSLGIVTSGIAYQYVREVFPEASILKLGWSFPFPDALIKEFAAGVDNLLVVEELEDFLEEHIKALGITCLGKRIFGKPLVPNIGELNVDVLLKVRQHLPKEFFGSQEEPGMDNRALAVKESLPVLPIRPPVLCPGCPHRGFFYALSHFDVVVTGDIGCYTLGVSPPLNCMDTVLCMGGGVSLSHGLHVAGNDRKVVGVVGDSTFFHSGMTGLLDITYNRGASVVVVLDNRTTGMTGHQDNPGTGRTINGEPTFEASIAEIGKALGVTNVVEVKPGALKETKAVLKKAIESDEPWLIIAKTPCPLAARKMPGKPLSVIQESCKRCGACLKLGCPAIEKSDEGIRINELLCAGCDLCAQVCPFKALSSPNVSGQEGRN